MYLALYWHIVVMLHMSLNMSPIDNGLMFGQSGSDTVNVSNNRESCKEHITSVNEKINGKTFPG